mgnify:CR=1 FL=1
MQFFELECLGRVKGFLEELGETPPQLNLDEHVLRVTVLGEFSTGKSTLINALLGEHLLPTRVTPTTAVITKLVHGPEYTALVHYADGTTGSVQGDLVDLLSGEESTQEISHVLIEHPLIPPNMELVDTPGTNDISESRLQVLYSYLPTSDLVLMVLNARAVLKQSEVAFLRERILGADLARVKFVINQIDTLDQDELEEVQDYVGSELAAVMAEVAQDYLDKGSTIVGSFLLEQAKELALYWISALEAARGGAGGDFPRLAEELRRAAEDLQSQRRQLLFNQAEVWLLQLEAKVQERAALAKQDADQLLGVLAEETRALDQSLLVLRRQYQSFRQEIDQVKLDCSTAVTQAVAKVKSSLISGDISEQAIKQAERELRRSLEAVAEQAAARVGQAARSFAEGLEVDMQGVKMNLHLPVYAQESKAPSFSFDEYFARPSVVFMAYASMMLFGPIGLLAVSSFPLLKRFLGGKSSAQALEANLEQEFLRLENQAKNLLVRFIAAQITRIEDQSLEPMDAIQRRLSEVIAAISEKTDLTKTEELLQELSTARRVLGEERERCPTPTAT